MSSSDRSRGDIPGMRPDLIPASKPAGSADPSDPYASWLDRMQRARARHAAITKNLYTWSNYKNWAEKMKGSFEDGRGPAEANQAERGPAERSQSERGQADRNAAERGPGIAKPDGFVKAPPFRR